MCMFVLLWRERETTAIFLYSPEKHGQQKKRGKKTSTNQLFSHRAGSQYWLLNKGRQRVTGMEKCGSHVYVCMCVCM